MDSNKKDKKNGCLVPVIILIIGIVCLLIGIEFDLPVIKYLGFGFPTYAGSMYTEFVSGKKWTWKKHTSYILLMLLVCIVFTFIMHGRLW